jgi:small basic protein
MANGRVELKDGSITRRLPKLIGRVVLFALGLGLVQVVRASFLGGFPVDVFVSSFIGEVFIAITLVLVISKTRLKRLDLAVLAWLVLFVVQQFSNMLEGFFFTTLYSSVLYFAESVVSSLLTTLVGGVLAAVLFLPETHDVSLVSELSSYFDKRSSVSWASRVVVGSVAYFPIYFFFGLLITPFVLPYYTNPSAGLRVPSFAVIVPLEFFRGFLYVLSLLGIFATVKASGRTMSIVAASILFVLGALAPLISATASTVMPLAIIPFHLTEILADSVVYGAVLARLFATRSG